MYINEAPPTADSHDSDKPERKAKTAKASGGRFTALGGAAIEQKSDPSERPASRPKGWLSELRLAKPHLGADEVHLPKATTSTEHKTAATDEVLSVVPDSALGAEGHGAKNKESDEATIPPVELNLEEKQLGAQLWAEEQRRQRPEHSESEADEFVEAVADHYYDLLAARYDPQIAKGQTVAMVESGTLPSEALVEPAEQNGMETDREMSEEDGTVDADEASTPDSFPTPESDHETSAEDADDDEATTSAGGAGRGSAAGGGSGRGSGGSPPPPGGAGGRRRRGAAAFGPAAIPLAAAAAAGARPNIAAAAPANVAAANPNRLVSPGNFPLGSFLVGGFLGYLVGRRHGRGDEKKLEKQVSALHAELAANEATVRHVAAEKVRTNPSIIEKFKSLPVAKVAEKQSPEPVEKPAPLVTAPPALESLTQESKPVHATERPVAPEAHALHGAKPPLEHIGQMLIETALPLAAAESLTDEKNKTVAIEANPLLVASEAINESVPTSVTKPAEAEPVEPQMQKEDAFKRAETMNRNELLGLSENISIDGTTLRRIYETHLLSERGLRRLIAVHLRGGNLQRALRRELVEREIDFERDPVMRDQPAVSAGATTSQDGLDNLLQKATVALPANQGLTVLPDAPSGNQLPQTNKSYRTLDVVLVAIITGLAAIIIFFITQH